MKNPQTIHKVTPLELALVEFTDGEYKDSAAIVVFDPAIIDLDKEDPNLRNSVRVLDYTFGTENKWRKSDGVNRWIAVALQDLLKQAQSDEVAAV